MTRVRELVNEFGVFYALAIAFSGRMWFILATKFMPTKIETKTNELCEAILEQIQTGGIKQRIDTFLADASARGAYESLMSKGQALQEKQHGGQVLEPAEIAAFEKDRDIKMLLQIHDEIIWEAKEAKADAVAKKIKEVMENVYPLSIPLTVDVCVGDNWGEI